MSENQLDWVAPLVEKYTAMLGRPPKNINDCDEGVRDAEHSMNAKVWMGTDYEACYNITYQQMQNRSREA